MLHLPLKVVQFTPVSNYGEMKKRLLTNWNEPTSLFIYALTIILSFIGIIIWRHDFIVALFIITSMWYVLYLDMKKWDDNTDIAKVIMTILTIVCFSYTWLWWFDFIGILMNTLFILLILWYSIIIIIDYKDTVVMSESGASV